MSKQITQRIEALINEGKFEEGRALAQQSGLNPVDMEAVLGAIAFKEGKYQEAEVTFQRVLQANPNHVATKSNYTSLLVKQRKFKLALPFAKEAFDKNPTHEGFAVNYAACLSETDRFEEAVNVLQPLADKPDSSERVVLACAATLRGAVRPEEALALLRLAQTRFPDSTEIVRALADAEAEMDPRLAAMALRRLEKKLPDSVSLKWNASFSELRIRNFRRGWQLYEHGLDEKIGKIGRPLPAQVKVFPRLTELDEIDPNKWTLFTCEQGLGDQILFLGALREALQRFPKSALVAEERMVGLLQRSFPETPVYTYALAHGWANQKHRINGVFPIGSLMRHFRGSVASFGRHRRSYLKPDASLVDKYRAALQAKAPGDEIIGISWRGGYWDRQKRTKSFEFELFAQLMKAPGRRFVALQYGDVAAERAESKRLGLPVTFVDGIDFIKNTDAWFALAMACDRIISVSTALVHFVGAAGGRVDLLIGDYQAPFIWGLDEGRSLPYANVHIHRKSREESVQEFFHRVEATL